MITDPGSLDEMDVFVNAHGQGTAFVTRFVEHA